MLALRDLHKRFGERVAVDGLTLEVRRGEILGLLDPDRGTVDVDGQGSPRNPEVRRLLGVAPQAIALYEALTPEENLRFFGRVQGLSGAVLADRVEWALSFAALTDRRRDRSGELSGGMKRRLNLAAASAGPS